MPPDRAQRVLFTHGLSSVTAVIAGIRDEMRPGEFVLHASQCRPFTPLGRIADRIHAEPSMTDDDAARALDWLRRLCRNEGIALVWPQSRAGAWLAAGLTATPHPDAGPRWLLPVPDAATFARIADKADCLTWLAEQDPALPLPVWHPIRTPLDLAAALDALRDRVAGPLCIKPAHGIYGQGFRILDETVSPYERWVRHDLLRIGRDELAGLLAANADERTFLLMEYLPGSERSLDCLARHGELLAVVVRRKIAARWQEIEWHPPSLELARTLCQLFGLHGVINIQTRERADGTACLLEINPRMSGGIDQCRAAGCNLPLAALRMALDRLPAAAVPVPAFGARVGLLERGVRLLEQPLDPRNSRP